MEAADKGDPANHRVKSAETEKKKKKQKIDKQSVLSKPVVISSDISISSGSHQQHHSAPPSQNPQTKPGLHAINENVEDLPNDNTLERKSNQQSAVNPRFPRSSTVPYPTYATVRSGDFPQYPVQYYYSDYPPLIHGTISSAQANAYYNNRRPFSLINTNFQPISPHHQQYSTRPVDILKPTFLIVPKQAEQQLSTQLSASNSPVSVNSPLVKASKKQMSKKTTKKKQEKTSSVIENSSAKVRSVEVQTDDESPTRAPTGIHFEAEQPHIGMMATPNPSPYVHFVHVPYSTQSSAFFQEGPPETSIIRDEFCPINEYHQTSASIRSMPNIALKHVSPYHQDESSSVPQQQQAPQQTQDDQQQLNTEQQPIATVVESTANTTRSSTLPQMVPASKLNHTRARHEIGETDESSVISLDFGQVDVVDMPGSWRYRSFPDGRSVPVAAVARRQRAPIPHSFLEAPNYVSDSEQVVRSSSYRQPQQPILMQSRPFGSIPAMNRPFDSIRSQQTVSFSSPMRLNEKEVLKISSFYQSIGTLVYVARSVATLYTSDFDAMANLRDWKKLYRGVPIWLFNTGMNPKRNRSIRLIISELGSSFILWDTIVNGASDVRLPKARHITLKSLETGTILALKFEDNDATEDFHQHFVKLSSDARNSDLFDIFNAKRRRPVFVLRRRKIKKSAISKPTEFNHINKVDEHDRESLYTYSVLVDDGIAHG